MLQMVKTLAQFTIALEDMRELGPAAASGEPAGGSCADSEELGEAQVGVRGRAVRTWALLCLGFSRPGRSGGRRGQMMAYRAGNSHQGPSCLATGFGAL